MAKTEKLNSIKVILVDDHAIVRAGFRMLLTTEKDIEVVAEAERGEQALQLYSQYPEALLIMDLSMPGIGGLETIRRLCSRAPDAVILVFSVHEEQAYVNRAMEAGAKGYITKNSAPEILSDAIRNLATGAMYIEKGLLNETDTNVEAPNYQDIINCLTPREFDIFLLLAKGSTVHHIADQLCLSYKTAANYSTQIKKKFAVESVAELTHIALLNGMIKS